MSKLTKLVCVIGLAAIVSGCSSVRGNGESSTELREADSFSKVSMEGAYTSVIQVGEPASLSITADQNLQQYISSSVSSDRLSIKSKRDISSVTDVVLDISTPTLNELKLSGSSDVVVYGKITDSLNSKISGSGSIIFSEVDVDDLSLRISGSGDIETSGYAESLTVSISGSSDLDLSDLNVKSAIVDISGSGSVILGTVDSLEVDISGSGKMTYLGATMLNSHISGSGSVNARSAQE
jgi:hypothetical protein